MPAGEGGAQQLHGRHQVEHETRNGHVDKIDIRHGHGHLVWEVDHDQQHIVAQAQWETHQEVDEGEDWQDEAKVPAEPEVHAGVRLIVNHADPHRWALTRVEHSQQVDCGQSQGEKN